ncbi:MAG TPA: 50S ribosomal protein L18 [Candidatus Nanoarchaeia archaeon]|nr:50S ribosomal protein L18 [Candidatus Nanoarchaeia archaeon]
MEKKKVMQYRRKREGKTNYKKRLLLLKSKKPRVIIRKTNKQIILQIAEYAIQGDKIVCGTNSASLQKLGWKYSCNNLPACYLAGLMIGKKALAKGIKEAVVDVGLHTTIPGSRVYAAVNGAIDAGMKIPASEDIFPPKERLSGEHIAKFFALIKEKTQFTDYRKRNLDLAKLKQDFEDFKKKITSD